MATRAVPKTVRVRRADYAPEPTDEPTGPPKVLFWFRLGCVLVALFALWMTSAAFTSAARDSWRTEPLLWAGGGLIAFIAYTLPLWWRRPKWWHWIYGMALLLPGIVPATNPLSVTLLVFWCLPRTVRFFRNPPPSYAITKTTPTTADVPPATEPPGVLFALRWLCLLGCGACLLAMPITAVIHAADPNAGWEALWWLGGFVGGFGLFVVPLFARTPRRWVWWYGVVLLVLCSLSLYFTLLAVPILVFWLMKRPREYFASSVLANPVPSGGGLPAPAGS